MHFPKQLINAGMQFNTAAKACLSHKTLNSCDQKKMFLSQWTSHWNSLQNKKFLWRCEKPRWSKCLDVLSERQTDFSKQVSTTSFTDTESLVSQTSIFLSITDNKFASKRPSLKMPISPPNTMEHLVILVFFRHTVDLVTCLSDQDPPHSQVAGTTKIL